MQTPGVRLLPLDVYAVLVSFQNIQGPRDIYTSKLGYDKIARICKQALDDGLEYGGRPKRVSRAAFGRGERHTLVSGFLQLCVRSVESTSLELDQFRRFLSRVRVSRLTTLPQALSCRRDHMSRSLSDIGV